MELRDYYFSKKQCRALKLAELNGGPAYKEKKFKGRVYTESIEEGRTPELFYKLRDFEWLGVGWVK